MPTYALAFIYWLHLLATITWLGGMLILLFVVWPDLLRTYDDAPDQTRTLLDRIEDRFRPLANLSLAVLLVTGLIQMGDDQHYEGFLQLANKWSIAMLLKHFVFIGMIAITATTQMIVLPGLKRATLLARHDESELTAEFDQRKKLRFLTTLNLGLGILVLLFTAVMTAL